MNLEAIAVARAQEQLASIDFRRDPDPQPHRNKRSRSGAPRAGAPRGEANGGRRSFTPEQVRAIREAHAAGASFVDLSVRYEANASSIGKIVTRRNYAWVTP